MMTGFHRSGLAAGLLLAAGREQIEVADQWLRWGNPWEMARPEEAKDLGFAPAALIVDGL